VVYDLTYGVGTSALVRDARAAGAVVIDGLPMLVAQAERRVEWWTGRRPDPGVMARAIERRIAGGSVAARETEGSVTNT
jgi:shikimate 5-dehydrogenase